MDVGLAASTWLLAVNSNDTSLADARPTPRHEVTFEFVPISIVLSA